MKFLHITYHFEYTPQIEEILEENDLTHYVRYSMIEGKDDEGRHFGTQVHPGNVSVVQARVPDEKLDPLTESLETFKNEKKTHQHLEVLVLPVEKRL